MNKAELIDAVAAVSGESKAATARVIDAYMETVQKTVAKGGEISVVGFGRFVAKKRAARKGKNPATGEAIKIAATTVPRFIPGATFRNVVAGKKAAKKK